MSRAASNWAFVGGFLIAEQFVSFAHVSTQGGALLKDLQAERLAQNEVIFRRVNEHVRAAEERVSHDFPRFVCECANIDCDRQVGIPLDAYTAVRKNPALFFVFPGHSLPDIERLVESHDDYEIVEKLGPGRDVAERDSLK